jgi:hypothetical protein
MILSEAYQDYSTEVLTKIIISWDTILYFFSDLAHESLFFFYIINAWATKVQKLRRFPT